MFYYNINDHSRIGRQFLVLCHEKISKGVVVCCLV